MENLQNQKSNEELVAIPEKYMLTIREAASYFNIGIECDGGRLVITRADEVIVE